MVRIIKTTVIDNQKLTFVLTDKEGKALGFRSYSRAIAYMNKLLNAQCSAVYYRQIGIQFEKY